MTPSHRPSQPAQARLLLVTTERGTLGALSTVYVDALLTSKAAPTPPAPSYCVPPAENEMASDPSGLLPLASGCSLLVGAAAFAAWGVARWGKSPDLADRRTHPVRRPLGRLGQRRRTATQPDVTGVAMTSMAPFDRSTPWPALVALVGPGLRRPGRSRPGVDAGGRPRRASARRPPAAWADAATTVGDRR